MPNDPGNECTCAPGYFEESTDAATNSLVCSPCAVGEYKEAAGRAECVACPAGKSTLLTASASIDDCVCSIGFFTTTDGACEQCRKNTYQVSMTASFTKGTTCKVFHELTLK